MAGETKEDRLRALKLFRGADRVAIEHLATAADEVSVKSGRTLIEQGHRHNEIYVLESGSATVEVDGEQVADIPTGEFVGELGFFIGKAASATVKTSSDSNLLIIPFNRFDQILNDNPQLVRNIATELADRLYEMDERLN